MSYKSSFYNFLIPVEEKKEFLLYNSLTGGLSVLNKNKGAFFLKLFEKKEFELSQIDKSYIEFILDLIDSNYIIDSKTNENDIVFSSHNSHVRQQIESGNFTLTIVPIFKCNLSCRYCFQNPPDERIMDDSTFKEITQFIETEFNNNHILPKYKALNINWFGGEPLLEIKKIKKYSKKLYEISSKKGIKYHAFIVTNGTLLCDEVFQDLRDSHIHSMMITIDGSKATHDFWRPSKNGDFSSYERIIRNLVKMPNDFSLLIRINCSKNVWGGIGELFDDLEKFELWPQRRSQINFDLAYISTYDNARYNDREVFFSWREIVDLLEVFEDFRLSRYNNWAKKNNQEFGKLDFVMPEQSWLRCESANSPAGFVIDPEGYIYKCWEDADKPKQRIQHISTTFNLKNPKLKRWLNVDKVHVKAICKDCKVLPICNANCAKTILDDPTNFRCSNWKFNLEDTLKKQYIISVDDPQKINTKWSPDSKFNKNNNLISNL